MVILKLLNLEHLQLRFSKLSGRGLTLITESCLKLEFLDLNGCANLTSREIVNCCSHLKNLKTIIKPNFYIPRAVYHTERYGHWFYKDTYMHELKKDDDFVDQFKR